MTYLVSYATDTKHWSDRIPTDPESESRFFECILIVMHAKSRPYTGMWIVDIEGPTARTNIVKLVSQTNEPISLLARKMAPFLLQYTLCDRNSTWISEIKSLFISHQFEHAAFIFELR